MVNTLDISLSRYKLKEKKDKTNYLLVFFYHMFNILINTKKARIKYEKINSFYLYTSFISSNRPF